MKTTDFPNHLQEAGRLFIRTSYKYDPGILFADLIDYITCCTLWDGEEKTRQKLIETYKGDYQLFAVAYSDILKALHAQLEVNKWYDILGELYEICASKSKKSALGQFFTPHAICELMASLTVTESEEKRSGSDCAAGSGRLILAGNAKNPGITWYAGDRDPICAKMCAINMAWHGIQGIVWCADTLSLETFFGYQTNPWQNLTMGYPHIIPYAGKAWVTTKGAEVPTEPPLEPNPTQDTKDNPKSQLTLF